MNVNVLVETEKLSKEEWLRYRRQGIGGSDVASLIGINKWKSPTELWMEKTGQSNEPQTESEAVQWGNIMEPVLRNHFAEVTKKPVAEVKAILQHKDYSFMLANVDGVTIDDAGNPAILEIKTAGEYKRADWDGGVPAYYETQIQHYLAVTGVQKAYCAVLIGGNSFRIYEVDADAVLGVANLSNRFSQDEDLVEPITEGKSVDELKVKNSRPATQKQLDYLQKLMQQYGNTPETMNKYTKEKYDVDDFTKLSSVQISEVIEKYKSLGQSS